MAQPKTVIAACIPLAQSDGAFAYDRPTNVQGRPGVAPPLEQIALSPMNVSRALADTVSPLARYYSTLNDATWGTVAPGGLPHVSVS